MALLQNVIQRGTLAARPAAGSAGVLYFCSDTGQLYRDSGSVWQLDDTTLLFTAKGQLLASSASAAVGALAAGTDGYVLTADSTQTLGIKWAAASSSGLYSAYLCYQEQQTSGTASGTFTSGAWRTRTLNTEVADTGNHGTLASNQVTLDAGTYRVCAKAPATYCAYHQARLQNITDSSTILWGTPEYASNQTDGHDTSSFILGRFTIAGAKVIEVQHRCNITSATNGFGYPGSFSGTEIYTSLELFKE